MTTRPSTPDLLQPLLTAMLDGRLTDAQIADLRHLLRDDPMARRQYVRQLSTHVMLQWLNAPPDAGKKEDDDWLEKSALEDLGQLPMIGGEERLDRKLGAASSVHSACPTSPPCSIPPITIDPSPTIHAPFGHFLLSHVVAGVILGVGLLIGLAWRISLPSHDGLAPDTIAQAVGRITALADCQGRQWSVASGQWSEITNHQLHLGDRFQLVSGLMQVTYNSGAQVILQGPCTYEIDSERGGYLAVGKVTALVEKGSGGRGPGAGNANHSRLFAVRTPTAIVTDLGTEFGVEVEKSGATRSHVFQGSIEVCREHGLGSTSPQDTIELSAGESVYVERGRKGVVTITRMSGQPGLFVRQIPNSTPHFLSPVRRSLTSASYAKYVLSLKPAAYYRMERPRSEKDRLVVWNSAPGGCHGVFRSRDTSLVPYTAGRFGNAMLFRGASMGDCVVASDIPPAKDNRLTFTAWVRAANVLPDCSAIAVRWGRSRNEDRLAGVRFGITWSLPLHQWHHMAYVIDDESGKTTLCVYMNGQKMRNEPFSPDWLKLSEVCWGIGGADPALVKEKAVAKWYWQGEIDEVAIFNKVLSPQTIERLYLGGAAAVKGEDPHE